MTREIILTVDRDKHIQSETHGFKADECLSTLKRILDRAGLKVDEAKITRTNDTETAVKHEQKQSV